MLRYLALLIVCVLAVLAQAGPSMAHASRAMPKTIGHDTVSAQLTASSMYDQDCPSRSEGCQVMCAPCYQPLPVRQTEFAGGPSKSLQPLVLRQNCLRSIILSRDPPVPRNHML